MTLSKEISIYFLGSPSHLHDHIQEETSPRQRQVTAKGLLKAGVRLEWNIWSVIFGKCRINHHTTLIKHYIAIHGKHTIESRIFRSNIQIDIKYICGFLK